MNVSLFSLGWRTLWRDWRAGELRLLAVAVTLAVAALTSVAFFADRLNGGLQRDALQILGGDAVVASDNATPAAFVERARALGLQTVTTVGFPTMGRAGDEFGGAARLVAFKSVEPGYPLRGNLKVAAAPGGASANTREVEDSLSGSASRFIPATEMLIDSTASLRIEEEIDIAHPRLSLELRKTAKPGYVGLALGRILEVRDRAVLFDEKFAPPLLICLSSCRNG